MPRKLLFYRLRTLLVVSLIWVLFSIVFFFNLIRPGNDLGVHVSIYQFAFTFGIIGLIITAILIFYLKPAFHHQPAWFAIMIKLVITFLLFFVIGFVLLMIYFFIHYTKSFSYSGLCIPKWQLYCNGLPQWLQIERHYRS